MKVHLAALALLIPTLAPMPLAPPAQARPPWRPQVTVQPALELPATKPRLDEKTRALFLTTYAVGQRLLMTGQYRKAQPLLEEAIRLDPDHVEARRAHARTLLTLGYLHWNRALVERALVDIHHAMWLRPRSVGLHQLAELLQGLMGRMNRFAEQKPRQDGN